MIYQLSVQGETYIGVTARTRSTALASARERAAKHYYRAKQQEFSWRLCAALRTLGDKNQIGITVLDVVQGKAPAHQREVALRRELRPTLNTDCRGD